MLEIPTAIRLASQNPKAYDGYVALGVVIRGATAHFDIVAQQSAAGLMQLGVQQGLAIGNGILTVETRAQAQARLNKGAEAVRACLSLLALRVSAVFLMPTSARSPASWRAQNAARFLAVQALYQWDCNKTSLRDLLDGFPTHWQKGAGEYSLPAHDGALYAAIVQGVVVQTHVLTTVLDDLLDKGWDLARVTSILRALLRAGAWEILYGAPVPQSRLVGSYTDMAHAFLDEASGGMANAVLDKLAKRTPQR